MPLSAKDAADHWAENHPHRADVDTALQNLPALLRTLPRPTRLLPSVVHMLGTAGAGKSTVARSIQRLLAEQGLNYYLLNNDTVMESLPAYVQNRQANQQASFTRWEIPARVLGYALLQGIIEAGISVVYDHSGYDRRHLQLLEYMHGRGYKVAMVYPRVSLETAQARVAERMKQPGGRYTPPGMVAERHAVLQTLADDYRKLLGNRFFELDNNGWPQEHALEGLVDAILS